MVHQPDPVVATPAPDDTATLEVVAGTGVTLAVSSRGDQVEVELLGSGPSDDVATVTARLDEIRRDASHRGLDLHLAVEHPADDRDPFPELVADAAGLTNRRDLRQLRRPLPVDTDHPARASAPALAVRPFRGGADVDAWLRVNNRAFAAHPDQGRETTETLAARMAEPWFDPADFLVADEPNRPGELAGFCWTKRHRAAEPDPALGEIYIIGVDPSHRGEGLGPSFVLAGLDHLGEGGLRTAVLYVDADNERARRLYDRLGFAAHRVRRLYTAASS